MSWLRMKEAPQRAQSFTSKDRERLLCGYGQRVHEFKNVSHCANKKSGDFIIYSLE